MGNQSHRQIGGGHHIQLPGIVKVYGLPGSQPPKFMYFTLINNDI
jgi:hypothetical protein